MLRSRLFLAAVGAALVTSACRDTDLAGPGRNGPDSDLLATSAAQGSALGVVSRLDQTVPGFGGFYLDDAGRPTAFLADTSGRGAAVRALREELRRLGLQGDLRVLPASFAWRDLVRWHALASPAALAIAGVYWTDADEARNRVVVGVGDLQAMARVRTDLTRLGIPAGAVLVERADPVVRVATLRDEVRPVVGGIQIHFPGFLCTLGFNATAGGQASFVTASHCTTTQGG
ncbi:MAG TPA: hypothetical protein VFN96_09410, partial [Gemmatimonadales bacterium]|nr:hypothetical protein [Gemmatimonadales bacterium]